MKLECKTSVLKFIVNIDKPEAKKEITGLSKLGHY